MSKLVQPFMLISLYALELTRQWGDAAKSNPEVLSTIPLTLSSSIVNAAVPALVVISEFRPWKRKR